jgi:hypothetical protein
MEDSSPTPEIATQHYDLNVLCWNGVVINNGGTCPDSANVIDAASYPDDDVYVRDVGCPPGWPSSGEPYDFCPSPGTATQVCLMSGGEVGGDLIADDSSTIEMRGGTLGGRLYASGSASVIEIRGSNFSVDGTPVPLGDLTASTGVLTGTLESGDPINNTFFQGGGNYTGTIRLLPEPSGILQLLSGLTTLGLLARRRSRA